VTRTIDKPAAVAITAGLSSTGPRAVSRVVTGEAAAANSGAKWYVTVGERSARMAQTAVRTAVHARPGHATCGDCDAWDLGSMLPCPPVGEAVLTGAEPFASRGAFRGDVRRVREPPRSALGEALDVGGRP